MRKPKIILIFCCALLLLGCQQKAPVPAPTETSAPAPQSETTADTAAPAPVKPTDNAEPVTTDPAVEFHPKWSPDGSTLGYVSFANERIEIWLMSAANGSTEILDIDLEGDFAFVWSSDGSQIIFDAYDPTTDHPAVFQMVLPNGTPEQLTTPGNGKANPALSPDDTMIAFASTGGIWLKAIQNGEEEQLTTTPTGGWHPDFSPDGSMLLFTSDRSGSPDLWLIPTAGGEAVQITTYAGNDDRGIFSPDGQHIIFLSDRSGNEDIWLYSLVDQSFTQVTYDEAVDSMPSWHPDGKSIVFVSERAGNMDIWQIDISDLLADN